jgi:hypothetical protein
VADCYSYTVDAQSGIVLVRYASPMTLARWSDTLEQVFANAAARRPYRILADRRHVHETPTKDYIDGIVAHLHFRREQMRGSRWAHLTAAADVAAYGMGRMLEQRMPAPGMHFRVFTHETGALAWLIADDPDSHPDGAR